MKNNQELVEIPKTTLITPVGEATFPMIISEAGEKAQMRFLEFFTANIRNPNTRNAYARAVGRFCVWCEEKQISLDAINPVIVSAYVEELQTQLSAPSVKQHLAAIRMLFDWLVIGQIVPTNPATSVRGPKHVVKKGKTPVMEGPQAAKLLESIDTSKIVGLRDRALIGIMVYSFARISAVLKMNVKDYFQDGTGRTMMIRLHEKGSKHHEVPLHHNAEAFLDAYLEEAGISEEKKKPLFRSVDRSGNLTSKSLDRQRAWDMVRRRCKQAGLPDMFCNHTFRATGITVFMSNGGILENAQEIAAHASPRTTKLYDRTADTITLDEINRIDLNRPTGE